MAGKLRASKQNRIPKTLHYCWFGPNEMSALHQACLRSWRTEMPEYSVIKWDETNAPMRHPFVAYHHAKGNWAYVSDFVRLYALYEHGGIYLDTDVEVIRPFDTLLRHRLFAAYESENRINSAVFGARRNEVFLKNCMEYMRKRHERKLPYRIAPEVVTAVYDKGTYPEMTLLPKESFYPYNPYEPGSPGQLLYHDIKSGTYAIHHWAKSWKMKLSARILRKLL